VPCAANSNCITVTVNNVTPGTVAADQTICSGGDPAAFTQTAAATGAGTLTYQWQSSTTSCAAGFTDIAGATGTTYDIPSGLATTTYYRRVVTSTLGGVPCTANSNCITVTVNNVTAGVVAADQTICSGGDPAAFTVTTAATGTGALTYQWQSNTTGCGGTWANIAGATAATYDIPSGLATTTYYRRVVTSTLNGVPCSANSNCITVTINSVTAGTVAADQTICNGGDPAVFSETTPATGAGSLSYQWQSNATGCGGTWTNIAGATSATYDAPSGLAATTYYRRVVTSTLNGVPCSTNSNCITVTINNVTAGVVAADQAICSSGGDPTAFTVTTPSTGSGALTYQWQSSTTSCAAGFSNIAGATSATYDAPSGLVVTTYYRRVVTSTLNGIPCSANSNCITIAVATPPTISLQPPTTYSTCSGTTVSFTVASSGGSPAPTVQWQISTDNVSWSDINGATSTTLTFSAGSNDDGKYYRAVFSNGCIVTTTSMQLIVGSPIGIKNPDGDPVSTTACSNQPVTFTAAANGKQDHMTVVWQYSCTGIGGPWTDVTFGATNNSFTGGGGIDGTGVFTSNFTFTPNPPTTPGNGCLFRAKFSNGGCAEVYTEPATLTILPSPTATVGLAGGGSACAGNSVPVIFSGTSNAIVTYNINGGPNQTITLSGANPGTSNNKYNVNLSC
jgi:hypothetical protein